MNGLLPCPFCGGEADTVPHAMCAPGTDPIVFCDACHATAMDHAAWNRRAHSALAPLNQEIAP